MLSPYEKKFYSLGHHLHAGRHLTTLFNLKSLVWILIGFVNFLDKNFKDIRFLFDVKSPNNLALEKNCLAT